MVQHRRRGEGQGGGQEAGGARGEGSDTARGRVAGRTSSGSGVPTLRKERGREARGARFRGCVALCAGLCAFGRGRTSRERSRRCAGVWRVVAGRGFSASLRQLQPKCLKNAEKVHKSSKIAGFWVRFRAL